MKVFLCKKNILDLLYVSLMMPYLSFPLQNPKNLCFHDKLPMSFDYQNSKTNATYNWLVAYQHNHSRRQLTVNPNCKFLFVYPMQGLLSQVGQSHNPGEYDIEGVTKKSRLTNCRFTTISSQISAIYINIFHKNEIQMAILRCWMGLYLNWFNSYDT